MTPGLHPNVLWASGGLLALLGAIVILLLVYLGSGRMSWRAIAVTAVIVAAGVAWLAT